MKRTNNKHNAKYIWPFFWKTCCKCHKEFKWERGVRFSRSLNDMVEERYYVCNSCSPKYNVCDPIKGIQLVQLSKEELISYINRGEIF